MKQHLFAAQKLTYTGRGAVPLGKFAQISLHASSRPLNIVFFMADVSHVPLVRESRYHQAHMSAHKIWGLSKEIHTNAETMLYSSVLESEEASNTSFNPVGLRQFRGQLKVEHEVGRVTRGRQRAVTREHFVERADIDA